jgi:hypothetical protein
MENNRMNKFVKMEVNHFADFTEEEFNSQYLNGLKLKEGHHSKPKLASPIVS